MLSEMLTLVNCGKINLQKAKLECFVMEEEPHDTEAVDAKEEVCSAPEYSSPQQEKSSNNGQFKSILKLQLTL